MNSEAILAASSKFCTELFMAQAPIIVQTLETKRCKLYLSMFEEDGIADYLDRITEITIGVNFQNFLSSRRDFSLTSAMTRRLQLREHSAPSVRYK